MKKSSKLCLPFDIQVLLFDGMLFQYCCMDLRCWVAKALKLSINLLKCHLV